MRRVIDFAVLLALTSCGSESGPRASEPVLAVLTDLDPSPGVVEVQLVAGPAVTELLPGRPAEVWAFRDGADPNARGTVPGPMLVAELGDRVIVHFRNELPEETTIHWHGLRVPNASDGTPASQVAVPPGGTYDYEMTLVDAGLYWYHPHVRAEVQIERGLYAPILVRGGVEPDVAADRVFVLDDVKLEASGELSTYTDALDLMLGRRGNVVLVNGREQPSITMAAGGRERWRFVNVANGRYFQLELPGHSFLVIGWDGGLVNDPYESDRVLVAPGERYDVLVQLGSGETGSLSLRTVHYDRGHNVPDPGPVDLMTIDIGAPGAAPAPLPATWGVVAPTMVDGTTTRRAFVLEEDDTDPRNPRFTINGEAFPIITPVVASLGATEIWDVVNASEMDHPFHVHGTSFQILDPANVPVAPLGWKDTVNVPRGSTVSLAIAYDAPGRWPFHCHILEHAERGMMGELDVADTP